MSLFHRHRWGVHSAHFTPPPVAFRTTTDKLVGPFGLVNDLYRRLHEGVTTIYLKCERCGAVDSKEVYGEMRPVSDDELAQLRKMAGLK
jgi:hypothetical protein